MASTNKTANLGLNQWVLTDPFLMEDVNADNQKIDEAFGGTAFVKLMDVTTASNAQQVDLDVSGIDFTKYASVKIIASMKVTPLSTAQAIYAKLNGTGANIRELWSSSSPLSSQSHAGYVYVCSTDGPSSVHEIDLSGFPSSISSQYLVSLFIHGSGLLNGSCWRHDFAGMKAFDANVAISTISYVTDTSSVYIKTGSTFEIYGVRK